jgi:hypothetical protein
MTKLFPLNAKAIKAELKRNGVHVFSCKQGKGTTKNAIYPVIDFKDAAIMEELFLNLGVVSCTNKPIKAGKKCASGVYSIGACYMSPEMFQELNA